MFNVLDLGFFNAIQCLQHRECAKNVSDLNAAVQHAFADVEPRKMDDNFVTLQKVFECSIAVDGGNEYKLPHLNKKKAGKDGTLGNDYICEA